MIPILDWIFEGIVGWVSSIASQLLDAVSGLFLEALGTDMTAMEEYFPFVTKAYGVMQVTAYAILILIVLWQLFRAFGGPITEAENPWHLVVRGALFGFLIGYAKPIFAACLTIARAPYTSLMDLTMTGEDFTFAGVEQALTNGLTTLVATASVVGLILILILLIALGWNYFKLLLETVERYIVVGVLCYTSPLAFSMGASKSTSNVFKSWCRMVGSQLLLLVMNVWFLRGFASSMGQFIGNGGALTTGKGSIFLWMFCALAYLKCAQRFDSYLASMGLNVAQTGSSMGMELLMAARVISGVGSGARSAGSVFGRAGGATATGTGAAANGFAAGFASRFSPNSYVRDAVVEGGTRMGFSGGAGFVGRAFGGIAARNGATLNGQSISSVASRAPGASGTIAGDIADRSLSNYMPHMQGFQMKGTQITGGHISTTATTPDGKKANVDMYSASQFEKPDAPHSVVTASDGSQWYQMASGEGRGAFYDAPTFGGMNANPAEGAGVQHDMPGADGASQNGNAMGDPPESGNLTHENLADQPGHVPPVSEMPGAAGEVHGGAEEGIHLGNEDGIPGAVPGIPGDQIPGASGVQENGIPGVQPNLAHDGSSSIPEAPVEGNGEMPAFGAAFVGGAGIAPEASGAIHDADELPHPVELGHDEPGVPGSGPEGTQFGENFVSAENGQNIIPFPGGITEMPADSNGNAGTPDEIDPAGAPNFAGAVVPGAESGLVHESAASGEMEMPSVGAVSQSEIGVYVPEGEAPQFGAAFVPGAEPGQIHEFGEVGGMEMPAFTDAVHPESGATVPEGEAPQFGAAFIPSAEPGQIHDAGEFGGMDMPANAGYVQPEGGVAGHEGEAPQFGAAFVPGTEAGQFHEDGVSGGMEMPAYSVGGSDMHAPEGETPQFGAAFVPAPADVHEVSEPGEGFSYGQDSSTGHVGSENGHVADGDTVVSHIGGDNVGHTKLPETAHISEPAYSGNGAVGANAHEADSHAPQFGAGFVGGGETSGFDDGHYHGGAENGHYSGDSYHGGDHGGYAEAPLVAATFPNAQEGTMLRTVGDGVIEASSPDGGNTLWYNSAYFQEPDAPHSVMEAANGVQWYAMQQQAQAPQFESGVEAMQYNQAAFQNFMPGYDGQVAHVDGTHRLDGHFEVRNADGSGTAFYDTARYAAPRGDYQVMEDARGSQWYAIRGEAAVDRKPVFENGKAVYDDGKLRTVSVETVRYKQTPARFAEPQKRADIDRKPPRRKQ